MENPKKKKRTNYSAKKKSSPKKGTAGNRKNRKKAVWWKIAFPCVGVAAVCTLAVLNYFFPFFNPVPVHENSGHSSSASSGGTPSYAEGDLKIHFVDVGQGDCIMIELPDGKNMVIDGGKSSQKKTVYSYALSLGMEKIDYLVVSHADDDHYGGLSTLVENMDIGAAYLPFVTSTSAGYTSLCDTIEEKTPVVKSSERFDVIEGETYYMVFLWPCSEESYNGKTLSKNDSSAVIWLDYCGTDALFCGDISETVEKQLTAEWNLDHTYFNTDGKTVSLDSTEILKVAHHGSSTSSDADWLDLLNFQTAVISCGAGNTYGHPTQEALTRLDAAGGAIYRTDELGSIVAELHGDGTYKIVYGDQTEKESSQSASADVTELLYIEKNRYTEGEV